MDRPFQRIGSESNAHVGRDFEEVVRSLFEKQGVKLERSYSLPIGHSERLGHHRFDLGSDQPPVLVECKSHKWTVGGNSPSAKLTVWNEAMYFFHLAPTNYRKCLCVLLDRNSASGMSLATHYLKNHVHLVPDGVEIWEFDAVTRDAVQIH